MKLGGGNFNPGAAISRGLGALKTAGSNFFKGIASGVSRSITNLKGMKNPFKSNYVVRGMVKGIKERTVKSMGKSKKPEVAVEANTLRNLRIAVDAEIEGVLEGVEVNDIDAFIENELRDQIDSIADKLPSDIKAKVSSKGISIFVKARLKKAFLQRHNLTSEVFEALYMKGDLDELKSILNDVYKPTHERIVTFEAELKGETAKAFVKEHKQKWEKLLSRKERSMAMLEKKVKKKPKLQAKIVEFEVEIGSLRDKIARADLVESGVTPVVFEIPDDTFPQALSKHDLSILLGLSESNKSAQAALAVVERHHSMVKDKEDVFLQRFENLRLLSLPLKDLVGEGGFLVGISSESGELAASALLKVVDKIALRLESNEGMKDEFRERYIEKFIDGLACLKKFAAINGGAGKVLDSFVQGLESRFDVEALAGERYELELKQLTNLLKEGGDVRLGTKVRANEDAAVRLLSKIMPDSLLSETEPLSRAEEEFMAAMLVKATGNKAINKSFRRAGKVLADSHGISNKAVHFMTYFTFKTRNVAQFAEVVARAKNAWGNLELGKELSDGEKLKLGEMGILNDLAKLERYFSIFNERGLFKGEPKLQEMARLSKEAKGMVDEIEGYFKKEAEAVSSRDILVTLSDKEHAFKNIKRNKELLLTNVFITRFGHAAKVIVDDIDGEVQAKLSHVFGVYEYEPLEFMYAAHSEVYRLDAGQLLNSELIEDAKHYLGADIVGKVNALYEGIEARLHKEGSVRFAGQLENSKERRFDAGKADYGMVGGHKRKTDRDFRKLHSKIFFGEKFTKDKKMICSEFVAKTTTAALYELNQGLAGQLVKALVSELNRLAEGIDGGEYSGIELADKQKEKQLLEEKISRIINKDVEVIRQPFSKRERMKMIHPGRLIKRLQRVGALEKRPQSSLIERLIRQ